MKINKTSILAAAVSALFAASSYAQSNEEYIKTFGMIMFERNGLSELNLDKAEFDAFVAGMKAMNEGGKLPENIQEIGPKMMEYLRARAEANIAKEAAKADAEASDYWKELEKKEGIIKTPSGLAYEIITKGTDKIPGENSEVIVNYEGKLINGDVFDSSIARGEPAQFNLGKVIPGFREGLQKIGKGGKARLYIPAKLGYGSQPVPGIPVNSTLIFDVEMVDVDPAGAPAPAAPAAPEVK